MSRQGRWGTQNVPLTINLVPQPKTHFRTIAILSREAELPASFRLPFGVVTPLLAELESPHHTDYATRDRHLLVTSYDMPACRDL